MISIYRTHMFCSFCLSSYARHLCSQFMVLQICLCLFWSHENWLIGHFYDLSYTAVFVLDYNKPIRDVVWLVKDEA